jgi:hypothetical protein
MTESEEAMAKRWAEQASPPDAEPAEAKRRDVAEADRVLAGRHRLGSATSSTSRVESNHRPTPSGGCSAN